MSALDDLGKNRTVAWDDLYSELTEDGEDEDTISALYRKLVMSGLVYPAKSDERGRHQWRAADYKTIVFCIREYLATRRLVKEGEVDNVRVQGELPKGS